MSHRAPLSAYSLGDDDTRDDDTQPPPPARTWRAVGRGGVWQLLPLARGGGSWRVVVAAAAHCADGWDANGFLNMMPSFK